MYNTSPKISDDIINLSSDLDISNTILKNHCVLVPSKHFNFPQSENDSRESFIGEWDTLEADPHMADYGRYHLRRYGVFELNQVSLQLTYQSNATFISKLGNKPC